MNCSCASGAKTREQVKAELAEAVRSGRPMSSRSGSSAPKACKSSGQP